MGIRFSPGCACCYTCAFCSGNLPARMKVVLSGMAIHLDGNGNPGCANCSALNGAYYLDLVPSTTPGRSCTYQYAFAPVLLCDNGNGNQIFWNSLSFTYGFVNLLDLGYTVTLGSTAPAIAIVQWQKTFPGGGTPVCQMAADTVLPAVLNGGCAGNCAVSPAA